MLSREVHRFVRERGYCQLWDFRPFIAAPLLHREFHPVLPTLRTVQDLGHGAEIISFLIGLVPETLLLLQGQRDVASVDALEDLSRELLKGLGVNQVAKRLSLLGHIA